MKHTLKIVIPLVLVIALLIAGAWFFLSYRPDLACELYVNRAEAAISQGHFNRAVKYYTRAQKLYPEDISLSIGLADAYQRADNYTKAEYTLVRAITDNPEELQLYLELSKIYVEQDKLLDADQMLSHAANENIKAQLDALRPAAPVIQPEGGYYSEYVDVSLSYSGDAAYLSVNGDYPSLEKDLYTDPVKLDSGETTVVAMVVSAVGLVSPAVTAGYTIGGVVEAVAFQDEAVEATVREALGKQGDDPVMSDEMWALTELELPKEVKSLADLSICRSLTSLTLHGTYGIDFSVLGQLTNLETLDLSDSTVSSNGVAAIGTLSKLKTLKLSGCALTDVSALSGLASLTTLDLSKNAIADVSFLSGMAALTDVNLSANAIASIASLSSAKDLQILDIANNQITSLASLNNKKALAALRAASNQISDLSPLASCSSLQILDLSTNAVTDLKPVSALSKLSSLSADQNTIAALPNFSAAAALTKVSFSHNAITEISGLKDLPILNYVNLNNNQVSDLSPLSGCRNLVQVDALGNPLKERSTLQEHGVIVNYDTAAAQPAA